MWMEYWFSEECAEERKIAFDYINGKIPSHERWMAWESAENEFAAQREYENLNGCCTGGCSAEKIVKRQQGSLVCKWTNRPCGQQQLTKLVELYGSFNK